MNSARIGWLIPLSLLVAMLLSIARLPGESPQWVDWLRPDWAVALFFYWTVTAPGRIGMCLAWLAGLLFDALLGGGYPFGLHGAGFACAVFVAAALRERLQMYNALQEAGVVAALALGVQIFQGVVRLVVLDIELSVFMPLPALATMLVYPLLTLALRVPAKRFVAQ